MRRIIAVLLLISMCFAICACGNESGKNEVKEDSNTSSEPVTASAPPETDAVVEEYALIDDAAWDELEALGKVKAENGLFYVTITVPAGLAGGEVSQESLDANAGETYASAVLNEDGSVTYKMTKKQHKAMLDGLTESIDSVHKALVENYDYAFTSIEHNEDLTLFEVHLSTEEVGMTEGLMVYGFFLYAGMYHVFTGKDNPNIVVNYYDPAGKQILSVNSADMLNGDS